MRLICYLSLILSIPWAWSQSEVYFSLIEGTLSSQQIEAGELIYWDQTVADSLGIETPMGRVGSREFSNSIVKKLGREISSETTSGPRFFVELDAHGGAGRAAYLEVDHNVWVNSKGIGITGFGETKDFKRGPPGSKFNSHRDGSLTQEEAIREAIYARMMGAESRSGSSRVVAIIKTKRTITYEKTGVTVPLAIVIREPVRRYDQQARWGKGSAIRTYDMAESIAQAASQRFMKGDLVNKSNLGAAGEFVDFGCMSGTCEYGPFVSSEGVGSLTPANQMYEGIILRSKAYDKFLGRHLLIQAGIPEQFVLNAEMTEALQPKLLTLFSNFEKAVGQGVGRQVIDQGPIPSVWFTRSEWIREMLASVGEVFFSLPQADRKFEAFLSGLRKRVPGSSAHYENLAKSLFTCLIDVYASNKAEIDGIPDFSAKLALLNSQRSKKAESMFRPQLLKDIGDLVKGNPDPQTIQDFIEQRSLDNRIGTHGVSEGNFHTFVDSKSTSLYFRAKETSPGRFTPQSYPEWGEFGTGRNLELRLSTDGWENFKDYKTEIMKDDRGQSFFKVLVGHEDLAVTTKPVEFAPYAQEASKKTWFHHGKNIKLGSWLFNERLGLPPDIIQVPGQLEMEGFQRYRPRFHHPSGFKLRHDQFIAMASRASLSDDLEKNGFMSVFKDLSPEEIRWHLDDPQVNKQFKLWGHKSPKLSQLLKSLSLDCNKKYSGLLGY